MKILLFTHMNQIEDYAGFMDGIKKVCSLRTVLLTYGTEESEFARKTGAFDVVKDIVPARTELEGPGADLTVAKKALKELEERLGSTFINRDILMDRRFRGQPSIDIDLNRTPVIWTESRATLFMYAMLKRLEKEIGDFDPDFVFVEQNSAPYRMASRLARERGIPAGLFMQARDWSERVYLETGLGLDWYKARRAYRELATKPLSVEELTKVTLKLDSIIKERIKPVYTKWAVSKGAPDFLARLQPKRLWEGNKDWLGVRSRTAEVNPRVAPGQVYSPIAKYFRYRCGIKAKRFLAKHQTPFESIRTRKYAVYFLHVQPELTVEETAFDYQDQVNTLRNILAALPADMCLVVKEHLPMLGRRQLNTYSELMHMPGIILADPAADSHLLVERAAVVVTLTGSAALEAIYYGVPAIVLGSVFFDCFNGIYKPENLHELKELLGNPDKLTGASRDDAVRALGSMLRGSVPGKMPRIDKQLQEIDLDSAKNMLSELEYAHQEFQYSEPNALS